MSNTKQLTLRAKIMLSTLVPVVASFIIICSVLFSSLNNSLHKTTEGQLMQICNKHTNDFENSIETALDYLTVVASELEVQAQHHLCNREALQQKMFKLFDDFGFLDGSSVYFEPDMLDGNDAYYKGREIDGVKYGTDTSGRVAWYFYKDGGQTAYLPEGLEDDEEFSLGHYTEAKINNAPIYTDPTQYKIDGVLIPMFTLAYPIRDVAGDFIGAVTVDLFLEEICEHLNGEKIYNNGYIVIANDHERIIYTPNYTEEDGYINIGQTRAEAGLNYRLPDAEDSGLFFNAKSIKIGSSLGENSLVAVNRIFIPRLNSSFFVSISVPLREVNANGTRLMVVLGVSCIFVIVAIGILVFILVRKISSPINEITASVNKIASGLYGARIEGKFSGEFAVVKDSVNKMAESIEDYIDDSQKSLTRLKSILNGLDAYIYVSNPETGEILFINDNMIKLFDLQNDGVGQICYKVLQNNFDERCDFCPCNQLDKQPDKPVVWEESSILTKRNFRNTDSYIEWLDGEMVHLQHSVDITDFKETQLALDRRLKQQALMTSISQSFFYDIDIDVQIANALKQCGEFIGVSQILYYKLLEGGTTFVCKNEWINPETGKQSCLGIKQVLPEHVLNFIKNMPAQNVTYLCSRNPEHREMTQPYSLNFDNYITVPIFAKGVLYGALDIYRATIDELWSESDINFAVLISSLLSGVFEKDSMEGQLRRLSSIVESSPQYIMYITEGGTIDYVNPAAVSITGYSEKELLSGGLGFVFGSKTANDFKKTYIPNTFKNGTDSFELNLTAKNGRKRILAFSSFITGQDSEDIGCIASDVTEIRMLEAELIAAKELAEQSSRSKSEFLARMSHEMRTPLNAVIGMTNIAKSTDDVSKKVYCIDRIDTASRHLLGVINDVLDMSKIEADKFELSPTKFNFDKMLQRVLDVTVFRINEKQQNFTLNVDPFIPPLLLGDEQRLAQIITNLLSNAVKFTPEGGNIRLNVKVAGRKNNAVVLQIEIVDSGIGISNEQLVKLFRPFEQADGSISRKFGGTGLGLVISKRIIEMMGGTIWVESEVGKGAKFTFTVESEIAADAKTVPGAVEQITDSGSFAGKNILLAEDVEINREIVLTLLEDTGVVIDCAENGIEAVEMFTAAPNKYDLIFMDIHMPQMDGLEATVKIRALDVGNSRTVPIVAMTANVFKEDIEKCLAAGMNDHIGKPIDLADIEAKMKRFLG